MSKNQLPLRILLLPAWGLSAGCLITGWVRGSFPAAFVGMPFFLVLLILCHELGHVLGCVLNRNRVTGLRTPLFVITGRSLSLNPNPFAKSYCAFLTTRCDAVVYLCGPLASLACAGFWCICFLRHPQNAALGLCAWASLVHTLLNCLPFPNSDPVRVIKELKKRRSSA